jgi:hypothetical protein
VCALVAFTVFAAHDLDLPGFLFVIILKVFNTDES